MALTNSLSISIFYTLNCTNSVLSKRLTLKVSKAKPPNTLYTNRSKSIQSHRSYVLVHLLNSV